TDVNEAPSAITLASGGAIAENAANGTVVAQVAGHDPDTAHGEVRSSHLSTTATSRSPMPSTSGGITVANGSLLDYQAATSHALTDPVTAQGGTPSLHDALPIFTDVNEAPSAITLASGGAIAENAANGTVVAQVAGHDPDTAHGDVLSYALTDNAGGRFAIDATSGVITVANGSLLDYEAATSHAVTVRVTDQGGLTTTQTFALAVTDVNEAPSAITLASGGAIAENAANGTVVAQVAGHDPDTAHGDEIGRASCRESGGSFAIDATSGVITVANGSLLDYEAATSHAVAVGVTDQLGLTAPPSAPLAVTDVNEAPSAITLASGGAIAENAANGTVVAQVAGHDPDTAHGD